MRSEFFPTPAHMKSCHFYTTMLTGSGDLLLWSSGGGVTVIWWGGAKAESLLLLTNRGVSGRRKTELETRRKRAVVHLHHLLAWPSNVFYLKETLYYIILYLISQTPNALRIIRGGREKRRKQTLLSSFGNFHTKQLACILLKWASGRLRGLDRPPEALGALRKHLTPKRSQNEKFRASVGTRRWN